MLKGINQWCYPTGTPLEKIFEYSREAGFDTVELNLNKVGDVGLTSETTKQEATDIKEMASSYGIKLQSLSTALFWETPLSSADEDIQKQGINTVKKMLEISSYIGIDTILVVPGAVTEEVSYDDCYRRSQDAIKQTIATAEKYNVKIGIENVWNKFLLSPLEMARYIDELGSNHIGAYFDVGNVLQFGYPEQWIRILNKRIFKVHVKDFDTQAGNGSGFRSLLGGDVNWIAVIAELKEINYSGALTAELTPYKHSANALANDTARHLDVILKSK